MATLKQQKHLTALGLANRSKLLGNCFGLLTVIKALPPNKHRQTMWRCSCSCGSVVTVVGVHLCSGHTASCGCAKDKSFGNRNRTHGLSHLNEYTIWKNMTARCRRPGHTYHHDMGVRVCARWRKSFEAFLANMGPRPSLKHSLDRFPNNNGDYKPGNVRWATSLQQANNTRNGGKKRHR